MRYGCCGSDDKIALYDFENKLIIAGEEKIVFANTPNSKFDFYVSYVANDDDSLFLGTLFFCYNSTDKYKVKIKATPRLSKDCGYRIPDMLLCPSNANDSFKKDNDTYGLWPLNKAKNKEEVTGIVIKLAFECNTVERLDTLEIPIINGMPFCKDLRTQEYIYNHK